MVAALARWVATVAMKYRLYGDVHGLEDLSASKTCCLKRINKQMEATPKEGFNRYEWK